MKLIDLCKKFAEKAQKPEYAGFIFYCPEDQTMFMMKRSPNTSNPNTWSLPGGHMKEDESPLDGAFRECKEETGSVPKHKLLDSLQQGTYMNYIAAVHKSDKDKWKPELDWENVEWKWFPIDDLPDEKDLHPGFVRTLKEIVNRRVI